MAGNSTVAALTAASALDGTELLYSVQGGNDRKATSLQVKTYAVGAGGVSVASGKTLTVSNSITFAGTDSTVMTLPTTTATVARTDAPQTFSAAATQTLGAGSTAQAPQVYQSGTNLTSAVAGAREFDGVQHYATIDTSSGRGAVPVEQYVHLTADGSTISTIANFFGTTSNISLVSGAYYVIDAYLWFLNTTAGTVTWTLTNSAAPTSQNIYFEMSPVAGVVAPPGTATMLIGQYVKDATAARAFTTGTLTDAVNHYAHFKIFLQNSTGTSLKIQATKNVGGTITPLVNSYWIARRMSPNNIGTLAA